MKESTQGVLEVLSLEQERMFFLSQLHGDTAALHEYEAVWVHGEIDDVALKKAIVNIAQRHEILRTIFEEKDGEPYQRVLDEVRFEWRIFNLMGSEAEINSEAVQIAQKEVCLPFAMEAHPPWRVSLIRSFAHRHLLVLTMHHIISDGENSTRLFFQELAALYGADEKAAPAHEQPPLAAQYRDYARWQRSDAREAERARQLLFWKEALAGAPEALNLPISRPRPKLQTFASATVERRLSPALVERLRRLAASTDVELFLLLLAGLQSVFYRYSGQEDILIGTPLPGRGRPELASLIGYFGNPIVLRARFGDSLGFGELVRQQAELLARGRENSEVSFKSLVEELSPARNPGHPPLFQVLFLLRGEPATLHANANANSHSHSIELRPAEIELPFLAYEQVITAIESKDGVRLQAQYNSTLFDAASMGALLEHWEVLLTGALDEPQRPIAHLPLLTERERQRLLVELNDTATAYPTSLCLHQLFEKQAEQTPNALALAFGNRVLTYRELDQRANQLARHLESLGVQHEALVGICMERSLELIISILAVLKAGAAFLPMDASYPRDRLAFILKDSSVTTLLTQRHLANRLPSLPGLVCVDQEWSRVSSYSTAPLVTAVLPKSLAYVIYTSGSTGRPKGALIEHRGAVNLALAGTGVLGLGAGSRVLQFASPGFDACVWEVIMSLTVGGTLCIPEPGPLAGVELGHVLKRQQISAVLLPPSVLAGLPSDSYPDLQVIIAGGEACSEQLVEKWAPGRRFINAYGPTECTVCSTVSRCYPGGGTPSIGTPLPNIRVYVIDRHQQPVPVGVPGELYIGGAGIGRGYLNRPELFASRFIADPFRPGRAECMYRTGDLVRWRPDGTLEFIGRVDHQIKLRGFRIELGEIESVLREHPSVRDAVVMARTDGGGDLQLVAYVVLGSSGAASVFSLTAHLKQRLPDHMVPASILPLESLPLTASGKVNRAALPAPRTTPTVTAAEGSFIAPRTALETEIAAAWQAALGREQIGIHEDFFAIGGHSLRAAQVVARLRQRLRVDLSLRKFFSAPTIAGLAALLAPSSSSAEESVAIPQAARSGIAPLSFAQERLFFIHQLAPQSSAYNYGAFFRIRGALQQEALERALQALIKRHESLRTSFAEVGGRPVQVIAPTWTPQLELIDLSHESVSTAEALVQARISAEIHEPFDLIRGPLVRMRLLRLAADEHVLLLNLHHIITDGWSMDVLYRELAQLYASFAQGKEDPLPALPLQYADYALWNRRRVEGGEIDQQLAWWRERLHGAPTVLDLLTDRPRPAVQSMRGSRVEFRLNPSQVAAVRRLATSEGATPTMVALTALFALLHRYTNQPDFLVGLPHANRDRTEVEGLIGFFVNTVVVRCDLRENPSFRELLGQVRTGMLEAADHAVVPFERLVQALQPDRDLRRSPLVQVMFAPQVSEQGSLELADLTVEPLRFEPDRAPFDLTLYFWDSNGQIHGNLEYSSELFLPETAEQIAGHFLNLLLAGAVTPEMRVSKLPLLTAPEFHRGLVEWNRTRTTYPREVCIHELFEQVVERYPTSIAASFDGVTLTYSELNLRANRVAYRLLSEGVGPGTAVGLLLDRSLNLLVGLLAILKAGGAYVPLDPEYPDERLRLMLKESRTQLLISSAAWGERLGFSGLVLDLGTMQRGNAELANPRTSGTATSIAYLMFTSGSTGQPQAVSLSHRGIIRLVVNTDYIQFGPTDRVMHASNQSFDAAIFEVWGALLNGGCLVICRKEILLNPPELAAALRDEKITTLLLTTAVFNQMVRECPDAFRDLENLMFGGEQCDPARVRDVLERDAPRRLVHLYGPTENSTVSTWQLVRHVPADSPMVPIGRPIANSTAYILDRHLQLVPPGVAGEIYVGGDGIAIGYYNSAERTKERFIPDPFAGEPGARLYKTGDQGRYLRDGSIEFLGRNDNQVKIRGFRVELGEIEAALCKFPDVHGAAIVVRKDGIGSRSIAAYVVQKSGAALTAAELRSRLKKGLPSYMIPAAIVLMDTLPLTPNGKVDQRALPPPSAVESEALFAGSGPSSALENSLAEIWREVLGLKRVSVDDQFFDLGGHSLLLGQVRAKIRERLNRDVDIITLFQHPTIRALAFYLAGGTAPPPPPSALSLKPALPATAAATSEQEGVAIIGLAGRFPGASSVAELWQLLREGREGVARFSREELLAAGVDPGLLNTPGYVPAMGVLDGIFRFDAEYFGYSAQDARLMDPQQRLFLACSWEAMEDAGYDPGRYPGSIGVFGGSSPPRYWLEHAGGGRARIGSVEQIRMMLGNSSDFLASRVAYKLGLRGPAMNIQAACATSLFAVHVACQSLLTRQCDMALAGGVSLAALSKSGYLHQEEGVLSSDGHCRPYDADGKGTVPGSGVAMVVLKRLSDAIKDGDNIRAVILGSAVNNDGSARAGYTAPSSEGQADAIGRALAAARVSPDSITYVEGHGTATQIGDPVEVKALTQIFREGTAREGYCALGSIKSNLGHLDAAAGVTGLIKVVLAMQNECIPATLHFQRPNPKLELPTSPFFVPAAPHPWLRGVASRRAGVSSFGMGGNNAHVVLEEAPVPINHGHGQGHGTGRSASLLVLSARSEEALERTASRLGAHLAGQKELPVADVAYTLQVGRRALPVRRAIVARSSGAAAEVLSAPRTSRELRGTAGEHAPSLVFMFPGSGSQHLGMGHQLYQEERVYRDALDRCAALFAAELRCDLRSLIFATGEQAHAASEKLLLSSLNMATIFSTEYALSQLLLSWGLRPTAVMGHSLGEFAASCMAGVLSLEDCVTLVSLRGRLCDDMPEAAMLSVSMPESRLLRRLSGSLSIGAINGEELCTVSGGRAAVDALAEEFAREGVQFRRIPVILGSHSPLVEPFAWRLAERAATLKLHAPALPVISNVTGTWLTEADARDPAYWARHLRQPVRFADGLSTLTSDPRRALVEVGPGKTLATLSRLYSKLGEGRLVVTTMPQPNPMGERSERELLLEALGRLWCAGTAVDWNAYHHGERRHRLPLPTTPFAEKEYKLELEPHGSAAHAHHRPLPAEPQPQIAVVSSAPLPGAAGRLAAVAGASQVSVEMAAIWRELLGVSEVTAEHNFFDLGGSSLLAIELRSQVAARLGVTISVHLLFSHPTFGSLVAEVERQRGQSLPASAQVPVPALVPAPMPMPMPVPVPVHVHIPPQAASYMAAQGGLAPSQLTVQPRTVIFEAPALLRQSSRLLVRIQEGSVGRPPLFLFQSVGGTVFNYRELVRRLGSKQPVYAFRASGMEPGEPILSDIPSMAAHCLDELITTYRSSSYLLGGYSSGGTIAYEMATQLRARGYRVPLLFMIDTGTVSQYQRMGIGTIEDLLAVGEKLEQMAPDQWQALRTALHETSPLQQVIVKTYEALAKYQASTCDAPIIYFRARERDPVLDPHPEVAWMDRASSSFSVYNTPGNHLNMMDLPNVKWIARVMRRYLLRQL